MARSFVAVEDVLLGLDAEHHIAAHAQRLVELRFLRQIADPRPVGHETVAREVLVDAGHDAQQSRLARAVDPQHTDLGRGIEGQVDIVQDLLAARVGLGQALHMIDELRVGHGLTVVAREPDMGIGGEVAADGTGYKTAHRRGSAARPAG